MFNLMLIKHTEISDFSQTDSEDLWEDTLQLHEQKFRMADSRE